MTIALTIPVSSKKPKHKKSAVFEAINWARDIEGLTLLQAAVLNALATRSNDDFVSWPSYQRLARDICASRRAVIGAVKELELGDLIEIQPRIRDNHTYQSNNFRLILPPGSPKFEVVDGEPE